MASRSVSIIMKGVGYRIRRGKPMVRSNRWIVWIGAVLAASIQNPSLHSQSQDQEPPSPARFQSTPFLHTDSLLTRKLKTAQECIREESWLEAMRMLQAFLDIDEDVIVGTRRVGADGQMLTRWTGIRTEADRLLGEFPAPAHAFYQLVYGGQAQALLTQARQKGDPALLDEVVRRYYHTAAASEATRLLAMHHLDRGRNQLSSLCFARLLDRVHVGRLPPATLFAAVVAFRRAGNEDRAGQLWTILTGQAAAGLRLGEQLVALPELEKELARLQADAPALPGQFGRIRASGSLDAEEWSRTLIYDSRSREWLKSAMRRQEDQSHPVLPASAPLVINDKVIYRSGRGIRAVDVASGTPAWEWLSKWGLDRMMRDDRFHSEAAAWATAYMANNPHLIFSNSILGTLTSDGARIYAVDDLPIPPFPVQAMFRRRWEQVPEPASDPEVNDAVYHSRLLALDAETGQPIWAIGGRSDKDGELRDSYFLGPPLALDGRLYGVVEKNHEVLLACLDAARGTLFWTQPLAVPMNRLLVDVGRRARAVRLVYADGMLVCVTHVGAVVAVDLFHRRLAWAYLYRDDTAPKDGEPAWGRRRGPRELPRLPEEWQTTAPIIAGDKLVFAASDASALHCLDLRTGTLRWQVSRNEDDLYLAGVFDRKVLIVGRTTCRALHLTDGRLLWMVPVGLPAGIGVADGKIYYLPVQSGLWDKEPCICPVDLDRGVIREPALLSYGELPGNLVLHRDALLSQTVLTLTAYPRAKKENDSGN